MILNIECVQVCAILIIMIDQFEVNFVKNVKREISVNHDFPIFDITHFYN